MALKPFNLSTESNFNYQIHFLFLGGIDHYNVTHFSQNEEKKPGSLSYGVGEGHLLDGRVSSPLDTLIPRIGMETEHHYQGMFFDFFKVRVKHLKIGSLPMVIILISMEGSICIEKN